jgi:hypothetical protein
VITWLVKRGSGKCFGVQTNLKRHDENISLATWLLKRLKKGKVVPVLK